MIWFDAAPSLWPRAPHSAPSALRTWASGSNEPAAAHPPSRFITVDARPPSGSRRSEVCHTAAEPDGGPRRSRQAFSLDWRHPPTLSADSRPCPQTAGGAGTAACHWRRVKTKRDPPTPLTGDSALTVAPMAAASSATIARPSPEPICRFGPRSAR